MLLSCVLRLVPEALADGRFAGTVQLVDTGRTHVFGSVDELMAALVPQPRPDEPASVDLTQDAAARGGR